MSCRSASCVDTYALEMVTVICVELDQVVHIRSYGMHSVLADRRSRWHGEREKWHRSGNE